MKTRIVLLLASFAAMAPSTTFAATAELTPTDVVHAYDGATTLLQFYFPEELRGASIVHATVSYEAECPKDGIIVWAYEVLADWKSEGITLSVLVGNERYIDQASPIAFQADDCELTTVTLDISRLVRAWLDGTRENRGLVITSSPSVTPATQPRQEDISLSIVYRKRRGGG